MKKHNVFLLMILWLMLNFCSRSGIKDIIIPENASGLVEFAAKEVRKYVYQRTGEVLTIGYNNGLPDTNGNKIFIKTDSSLSEEEFSLQTKVNNQGKILEITGGSPVAVLYGVYEFAEQLGVRFYLDGDVIPDERIPYIIPDLDVKRKPLFSIRGIQPFHDFPEGPDWWNKEDYKAIITQLPKLKLNFIGFHTYPENKNFTGEGPKAEPMVWIGTEDQVNNNSTVKSAYPILHFNTIDKSWGYFSKKTGDFSFGGSQFFATDKYGPDYLLNTSDWPHSEEENIRIFNDFGKIQNEVFNYAHQLGIKVCIGTETSLTIPDNVKKLLKNSGIDPASDEARKMLYRGIFERIKRTYPLDYYWFWTPEHWTWGEVGQEEVTATENDLRIAIEAAREVKAPFQLATCGWVLGPPPDRSKFDQILPKEMPFSCINRNVGFEEIDESFVRISGRDKWAIP